METEEWLTRGTVWLALSLLVAGEFVGAKRPLGAEMPRQGRWLNRLGFAAFLAHMVAAFSFYHGWSQAAAYADTAEKTAASVGWNSGMGLYFNYAFALVWLGEIVWNAVSTRGYVGRACWITAGVRAFLFFMIFNGAVVFAHGLARWFGFVLCLLLAGCWWPRRSRTTESGPLQKLQ